MRVREKIVVEYPAKAEEACQKNGPRKNSSRELRWLTLTVFSKLAKVSLLVWLILSDSLSLSEVSC